MLCKSHTHIYMSSPPPQENHRKLSEAMVGGSTKSENLRVIIFSLFLSLYTAFEKLVVEKKIRLIIHSKTRKNSLKAVCALLSGLLFQSRCNFKSTANNFMKKRRKEI